MDGMESVFANACCMQVREQQGVIAETLKDYGHTVVDGIVNDSYLRHLIADDKYYAASIALGGAVAVSNRLPKDLQELIEIELPEVFVQELQQFCASHVTTKDKDCLSKAWDVVATKATKAFVEKIAHHASAYSLERSPA